MPYRAFRSHVDAMDQQRKRPMHINSVIEKSDKKSTAATVFAPRSPINLEDFHIKRKSIFIARYYLWRVYVVFFPGGIFTIFTFHTNGARFGTASPTSSLAGKEPPSSVRIAPLRESLGTLET